MSYNIDDYKRNNIESVKNTLLKLENSKKHSFDYEKPPKNVVKLLKDPKNIKYNNLYDFDLWVGNFYEYLVEECMGRTLGLKIGVYRDKQKQRTVGESEAGLEIKYDQRVTDTENYFFEEKVKKSNGAWIDSGFRTCGTSFGIGNLIRGRFYIIEKKKLISYIDSGGVHKKKNPNPNIPTLGRPIKDKKVQQLSDITLKINEDLDFDVLSNDKSLRTELSYQIHIST